MSTWSVETLIDKKERKTPKNGEDFDLVIVGAGPAGMSAALCAARAKLKTLLIEKALPGGQATTAYRIHNYLGFPEGILGEDLARQMENHMDAYDIYFSSEAVEDILNINGDIKCIKTELENEYSTKAVILATGLEPKRLLPEIESRFLGRGLSYYAQSDPEQYRGKTVAVIGGGNCACYAADYLSEFVEKLYIIHKSDTLKAVKSVKSKILNNPKIDLIWNSEIIDLFGIDKLEKIKIHNIQTGQEIWLDVRGVFAYVGRKPAKEVISVEIATDEEGFIITDDCMRTSVRGVYAVGDIRAKQIRQIATAVAEGMTAAINVERDYYR